MMTTASSDTTSALARRLLEARNDDGGWGYHAREQTRLEATCWSLLALLGSSETRGQVDTVAASRLLIRMQRDDGLLVDGDELPANLVGNGVAGILLGQHPELLEPAATTKLIGALESAKGIALSQYPEFRQDNSLQGWSWIDGTFSWTEPTAWCLIALKRAATRSPVAAARIDEAERLLFDRVCNEGGWNYGNAYVLGQALRAYVPTTALGLIALHDRREHDVVTRSLSFLEAEWPSEQSGTALGLTALCLRIYGRPTAKVEQLLHERFRETGLLDNVATMGLVLYALTADDHDAAALRVS